MTQLDVMYRFGNLPSEPTMIALGKLREVYGIRGILTDEAARTIRIEYDATRLSESAVHRLVRQTGLDIVENVSLFKVQPEPQDPVQPSVQ